MSKLKYLNEIMLDLRGKFKAVCVTPNGSTVKEFDWVNAVLDALIFSAIGFFTTYASSLTVGGSVGESAHMAFIAFALQFVTFLGIKRGIVKPSE